MKIILTMLVIVLLSTLVAVNTTRSEAVSFVVGLHPAAASAVDCPFKDIANDPNKDAICKAYALNITAGYSDTVFGPNDKTPLWQWLIFIGKLERAYH